MPLAWGCTTTHDYTVVHAAPGAISFTHNPGSPAHSCRLRLPEGWRRWRLLACTATFCSPAANGPRCRAAWMSEAPGTDSGLRAEEDGPE